MPLPDLLVDPDLGKPGYLAHPLEQAVDARPRLEDLVPGDANEPLADRLTRLRNLMTSFESLFTQYCYGRKFFTTKAGYMGWVPEEAITGDEICVFDGSKMPFVIRLVLFS